eukprot:scaffold38787_cov73-Cyclotella_meneghiniana.AAC.3
MLRRVLTTSVSVEEDSAVMVDGVKADREVQQIAVVINVMSRVRGGWWVVALVAPELKSAGVYIFYLLDLAWYLVLVCIQSSPSNIDHRLATVRSFFLLSPPQSTPARWRPH